VLIGAFQAEGEKLMMVPVLNNVQYRLRR